MRRYILFIFYCFFYSTFAQNDSLQLFKSNSLKSQHDFIENHISSQKNISDYIHEFLNASKEENDSFYMAKAYYFASKANMRKQHLVKAIEEIDLAINTINQQKNQEVLSRFFHHKGTISFLNSDFDDAYTNYSKAYDIGKGYISIENQLVLEYDIGLLKLNIKDHKGAIRIFKKSTKAYDSLLNIRPNESYIKKRYVNMLLGLGKAYTVDSLYDKALFIYDKSLRLSQDLDYELGMCYAIGGKGNVLTFQQKYDAAMKAIQKAKNIATNLKINRVLPYLFYDEGKYYYEQEKYKEAILAFAVSDSIMDTHNFNFPELNHMYVLLGKSYIHLGEHIKANQLYDIYVKKNSLNESERLKLHQKIFDNYDLKKAENKALSATKKSIVFENYFFITLICCFILLLLSILFFLFYRKKQQKNIIQFERIIDELKSQKETKSKSKHILSDEKTSKILASLGDFESNFLYLDNKYDLPTLAKKCQTNSNYLSKVINTHKGKTFSEYMSDLRIEYVLQALKEDKKLRSYTIQSIAEEIGFNKAESFAKSFKKRTGFNPSFYIKRIEKLEDS